MVIEIEDQFKATLSNLATYQNYPEGFAMVPLTSFHVFFTPNFAPWSGQAAPPKLIYKALIFFIFELYTLVPLSQTFTRHRN